MQKSQFMGTAPIPQLMLKLGIPSMLAQLVNMLYNIVDKIFIGHMSEGGIMALGGIGISTPIIFIIGSFSGIVSGGGPPLAAIALGKGDKKEAEEIFSNCVSLLFCISLVSMLFVYFFKVPLLYLFGASGNNISHADTYLSYYILGTFFVFVGTGLNGFISAQGRADIAMRSVIIGAVANILLDPIFIYLFHMGVKGAAIATVIAQFLSAAFIYRFFYSPQSELKIKRQYLRMRFRIVKNITALGVSHFVMQSTEAAVVIVMNRQLLAYGGDVYVAAFAVMRSISSLVAVPMAGYNQGMQPLMSYNFGAGNTQRIKLVINRMLRITFLVKITFQLSFTLFPRMYASIFTKDPEAIAIVSRYVPILLAGTWIFAAQNVGQTFFVSTNKPVTSLFVASLRKVILLIPLALILPGHFGLVGIYLSEGVADTLSAATSGAILWRYYRKL